MKFSNLLFASVYFTLFLFSGEVNAQKFYTHLQGGYGIGYPGSEVSTFHADASGTTYKDVRLNLGGGLQSSLSIGYMFKESWGLEMQFFYQNNTGHDIHNQLYQKRQYTMGNVYGVEIDQTKTWSSWSAGISPSIVFRMGKNKFIPFVTLGPSIYYNYMEEDWLTDEPDPSLPDWKFRRVYEGRLSFGTIGNAGIDYKLGEKLFVTTTARFSFAYIKPSRSVIKEQTGVDLNSVPLRFTTTEYVEKVPKTQPKEGPYLAKAYSWDYSSFSLLLGLRWVIN